MMERAARSVSPEDRAAVIGDAAVSCAGALVEFDRASVRTEGAAAVVGEGGSAGVGFVKINRSIVYVSPVTRRGVPHREVTAEKFERAIIDVSPAAAACPFQKRGAGGDER